jgi:hypothetical protein
MPSRLLHGGRTMEWADEPPPSVLLYQIVIVGGMKK